MEKRFITTGTEIAGYEIKEQIGIVRGITVRSRSIIGNFAAGIQSIFGGNISIYTELCEQSRQEAFDLMVRHGDCLQANAIIAMRYDANEVAQGITEVLCYGTAVVVVKK